MSDPLVWANDDMVMACAHLVDRSGASGFEIGYVNEDVPIEEAGWYAHAQYQGARLTAADHRSPTLAALALAERLLRGARCKCRQMVTLSDAAPGCRWRLVGARWESGCDDEPIHVNAERGDITALQEAMAAPPSANRAERRRRKSGKGGGGSVGPSGGWRR